MFQEDVRLDGHVLHQGKVQCNLSIALFVKALPILRHPRKTPFLRWNDPVPQSFISRVDRELKLEIPARESSSLDYPEPFKETVGAGISGSGGGGGGSSCTGSGGGGATFFAHPTPDIIRAAMTNTNTTSEVVDLRMAASPSLVLRFNSKFQ